MENTIELKEGAKLKITVKECPDKKCVTVTQAGYDSKGELSPDGVTVTCTCTDDQGQAHSTSTTCPSDSGNTCDCSDPDNPVITCG